MIEKTKNNYPDILYKIDNKVNAETSYDLEISEKERWKQPVTINAQSAPFADIISSICKQTQASINYDDKELENLLVSVNLHKVPLRVALVIITEKYNLSFWEYLHGNYKIIRSSQVRITKEWREEDIQEIIDYISEKANEKIYYSKQVQGKISADINDVIWQAALEEIAKQKDYILIQERKKNGIRYLSPIICTREELKEYTTEIYPLSFIDLESWYARSYIGAELQEVMTTPESSVTFDSLTNTAIVTALTGDLEKITEIIHQIDKNEFPE